MTTTDSSTTTSSPPEQVDELEWEEWDGSSPFFHHCIAGSVAGVAEHTLLYPMDTIKTHMQSYCADCPHNERNKGKSSSSAAARASSTSYNNTGIIRTTYNLISSSSSNSNSSNHVSQSQSVSLSTTTSSSSHNPQRILRLFRGIQTIAIGCIPAHALYFSSYEAIKYSSLKNSNTNNLTPLAASIAGATATFAHDLVMTPLDTVKQRLQLGHYRGTSHAFSHILQNEGPMALYRSLPITLVGNVPYGMIMVSTNEAMKKTLRPDGPLDLSTSLMAGSVAGLVASAITTPLDRVKTRLQTQRLGTVPTFTTMNCDKLPLGNSCAYRQVLTSAEKYEGMVDALGSIVKMEGVGGLWRGWAPRVLTHTPAVAICWTTYEMVKTWLRDNWGQND